MKTRTKRKKPAKPVNSPLTPHSNGQWCKRIRNGLTNESKVHFFGVWEDHAAALGKYLDEKDDLQAGRIPKSRLLSPGKATTQDMVNLYLQRCENRVAAGRLSAVSFADYVFIGKRIVEHLGRTTDPEQLRPQDFAAFLFAMQGKYSLSRWSKTVAVTKAMFKWAFEAEVINHLPRFGPDFSVASQKDKQVQKNNQQSKVLSQKEIQALLKAADDTWKAILLLSINGALGNSDIARLKLSHVDGEWLNFPRGKTAVPRRIWLWPETRAAIAKSIKVRRQPQAQFADLLFVTDGGRPMVRIGNKGKRTDRIAVEFGELASAAGINKPRCGLYWLRHTFQNVGDEAKDPVATSAVMGHSDGTMASHYRNSIPDERLRAVCDHVRRWLFSKQNRTTTKPEPVRLKVVG